REWKQANPDKALDNSPFWMTGEAWGHGVMKSDYYRYGFDAMIMPAAESEAHLAILSIFWGIAIMVIGLGMQVKVLALAPDATDVA
ncbi:hypothetical protein MJM95_30170, partial [Salmonella enterica subsp. enterica serovar Anatum]|nr:hypothetical protein [Salmonella enterica subsp. enterica serovar Anatum]